MLQDSLEFGKKKPTGRKREAQVSGPKAKELEKLKSGDRPAFGSGTVPR